MNNNNDPGRHLPLDGAYNVRDLGGYATLDGRETRWRTIFRAAGMSDMTSEAQQKLIDEGVQTVIDFRGKQELVESPNVFHDSPDVLYRHHNIIGEEIFAEWAVSPITGIPVDRLSTMYRTILDRRGEQFRRVLATLAEPAKLPAIYHCSAGKDRTGVMTALLLGIAGVPDDIIAEDYGLSAVYLYEPWFKLGLAPDNSTPKNYTVDDYRAQWCPPEAMLKTLRHLGDNYGGIEGYATVIGVTSEQIASIRDQLVG
ncbi:MAG: tyrosine-protein phosphatase [Dehalococcoidia bacterium]|jgi:protein-tyrosine phosphatase|nr:tyrosine-protein phosphatase [Dehalococcoidia bacterium]